MLYRYRSAPSHVLARELKELRNKRIPLIKVLWHQHVVEEATWEIKKSIKSQYLNLFHESREVDIARPWTICNTPNPGLAMNEFEIKNLNVLRMYEEKGKSPINPY
ncbi:receptor-like protein kinase [Gossypium australe]|uniref:Receptor-like protein kinase n=1 Tax=Gossypium australe TaxID=47621 RepID=A0A5B6WRW8_9ROSI|nr:receptor-like protein kinase [Gossypium australe]